jgi:ATP-dependent RNA helicase RhlE
VADRVEQRIYSVRAERKAALLLHLLQEEGWDQVLVFSATKAGADVLVGRLHRAGVNADVMHGDRDMKERRRALEAFTDGKVQVLVATDVAQRGLDIEGISHVVNYDVPRNPEDYVHRIGRTARAGASGTAVTFVSAADLGAMRGIEIVLGEKPPRLSIEGFDYESALTASAQPSRPAAATSRTGGRMGTRRAESLSPEQLEALLRVG